MLASRRMVSLMQPTHSWVARWLKMNSVDEDGIVTPFLPGLYAISLPGVEAEFAASNARAAAEEGNEDEDDEEDGLDDEDDAGDDEAAADSGAERELAQGGEDDAAADAEDR